jgi:hypothetical protein
MTVREALLVAIADYHDPKLRRLRAPATDAAQLSEVLGDPDIGAFDVQILLDPDERTLRRRLATFFRAERRSDDVLLVHFSCHGVKDERGELYLAATDTDNDLLAATAVSATWLNDQIGRCRSKRIVVLLDCCFSGAFPFGTVARAGTAVNATALFDGSGRAVISSSNAMEYAYEGDALTGEGNPSVFTDAVVHALRTGEADRDGDHWISLAELYDYVFERVREATPDQTPKIMTTLEGPLHIARSNYEPPVAPATLDPELVDMIDSQRPAIRLAAVEDLAELGASADRAVALAAHQALERLLDDDSRRVTARASEVLAALAAATTREPSSDPAGDASADPVTETGAGSAPPAKKARHRRARKPATPDVTDDKVGMVGNDTGRQTEPPIGPLPQSRIAGAGASAEPVNELASARETDNTDGRGSRARPKKAREKRSRKPWSTRRKVALAGLLIVVVAAAGIGTYLATRSKSNWTSWERFSANAPWRLIVTAGPTYSCNFQVANSTNSDVKSDYLDSNKRASYYAFESGSFRFRHQEGANECTFKVANGTGPVSNLPVTIPTGSGDSNAFRSSGNIVIATSGAKNASCYTSVHDLATGETLGEPLTTEGTAVEWKVSTGARNLYLALDSDCSYQVRAA